MVSFPHESRITNQESGITNHASGITNPESGITNRDGHGMLQLAEKFNKIGIKKEKEINILNNLKVEEYK